MRTELQRIQEELNTTTIYVTHDQEEAMSMSDRIVVLADGNSNKSERRTKCTINRRIGSSPTSSGVPR